MKTVLRKKENWCWLVIIAVTAFIHCFQIGSIPYGINVDEMGMGYDAWCLANFGTDRYLNSFPVYLINFSGGQSALYAYLCAPFVYLFGISATVLRIPAVIFSFITLFFSIRIADYLWSDKRINLLVGFIYMVSPVFLMLSRIGLDCNLMLGMATVFLYFVLKAVDKARNRDFFVAGVWGGLLLYSYVISHMLLPVFLLLLISYLLYTGKVRFKQIVIMAVPLFLLALPLILMHIVNMLDLGEITIGIFTIPKLYRYRSDDLSWQSIGRNLIGFFKTTLMYDHVRFNSIKSFYNMYVISIPFIFLGMGHGIVQLIKSLKRQQWNAYVCIVLWMISVYVTGIFISTAEGPNVYQVNSTFLVYLLFSVDGMLFVYRFFVKQRENLAKISAGICIGVYVCFFASFVKYYFCDYTNDTYLIDLFNFQFEDVLEYMEKELPEEVAERVTYIGDSNQTYIFYLGSTLTTPYEYNQLIDDSPYTLWLWTESYKNYRFNFPEEIDPLGNYIVPETSIDYIQMYEQYGFEKVHIGTHYLFWNAMLNIEESTAKAVISWDHGVVDENIVPDDGEMTVLSGWGLNTSYGTVWDDIIAYVDGKYYMAEKMERKDVAEILQNEALEMSGFHLTIPTKDVQKGNVKIKFIDYKNNVCYVEEYK